MSLKVLFISANPSMDLDLDEEIRSVQKTINEHTEKRGSIEFIHRPAVRMSDLISALRQEKPHILHFSGHGLDGGGELCMIDEDTKKDRPIPIEALSVLFQSITKKGNLKLVFLNSCYSKVQADVILKHVDYVIGMNDAIEDGAAKTLSTRFYASFATGASIEDSFDDAQVMVLTNHYSQKLIPELLKKNESVEDFSLVDIVGEEETKSDKEESNSGTNITIKGNVSGVANMSGGTLTQSNITQSHSGSGDIVSGDKVSGDKVAGDKFSGDKVVGNKVIHNKTIKSKNNFENFKNDGEVTFK